jgi:MGT family glycosyltransferase
MREAIEATDADLLVVDTNSWGAQAVAEASGFPWATFQPYFTSLPAPGVPPFGPGFTRSTGIGGRIRDALFGRLIFGKMAKTALPSINAVRTEVGLTPFESMGSLFTAPRRVIYFTTAALEYPREEWPPNFRFVGPGTWAPVGASPDWLAGVHAPIALVTCSTERQGDRGIIETALRALPGDDLFVVATSAAHASQDLAAPAASQSRVEQFIPHDPVIDRAGVVVCHGGMGITQRALAKGVPVVVVPFGRDQLEVARRVEYAQAGVCLMPKQLSEESLRTAVERAMRMTDGARRIARELAAAGGASAAADVVEELLGTPRARAGAR